MKTFVDNIYFLIVTGMLGIFLLVSLMILLQVSSRNKLLVQRRKMAEEEIRHQHELMHAFIRSQEMERRRIGMDLHDEVGTALSSLRMILEREVARQPALPSVEGREMKKIIDGVMVNVRNISHDLSPLLKGAYELKEALEDLTERISSPDGLKATLDWEGTDRSGLQDPEARLALYRVLSELVNNTIRHARATRICISICRVDEYLRVDYSDDGIGIVAPEARPRGRGMMNIESRLGMLGATWSVNAPAGKGFRMQMNCPVK
jgi:signal transduction histidine kinase